MVGHADRQDQQRDRDREDTVAEGDDPRELDLILSRRFEFLSLATP
jgi:hypothetical protein